ncbi:hypothetical protein ACIBG8_02860 [Nonomuraea sp. NPDC050556]|uniref:hypothetical protein n=1 Tax=Nonomuraea sp. NPDC050556 TaxID=3364369 RepID=UPI00378B6C0B
MRVARWFLLVALALGVCGMHSLGHVASGHAVHDQASGMGEKAPDLDPTAVCLAVLTSLLILFVAALAGRSRRAAAGGTGARASVPGVARAPPGRTRSLVVLRI